MSAGLSRAWRISPWSRPPTSPSASCAPRKSSSRSCLPGRTTAARTPLDCKWENNIFECWQHETRQMKWEIATGNVSSANTREDPIFPVPFCRAHTSLWKRDRDHKHTNPNTFILKLAHTHILAVSKESTYPNAHPLSNEQHTFTLTLSL